MGGIFGGSARRILDASHILERSHNCIIWPSLAPDERTVYDSGAMERAFACAPQCDVVLPPCLPSHSSWQNRMGCAGGVPGCRTKHEPPDFGPKRTTFDTGPVGDDCWLAAAARRRSGFVCLSITTVQRGARGR
jgi:hypothetical protein